MRLYIHRLFSLFLAMCFHPRILCEGKSKSFICTYCLPLFHLSNWTTHNRLSAHQKSTSNIPPHADVEAGVGDLSSKLFLLEYLFFF